MDIVFHKVCKSFEGRTLFSDLDLTFKADGLTCITGRSGCGKTTLLRMLMGFETPDRGRIDGLGDRKISAVFQEDRLCEALSASANAAIVANRGAKRSFSDDILRELGLSDDLLRPVSELSGGMRRRVAIARALSAEYDMLLLDEPFTGLDPKSRDAALKTIMDRAHGKTILLVTHDRDIPPMTGGETIDLETQFPVTIVK